MIPIDDFQSLADELALELPQALYEHLNGGIVLLENSKLHIRSRPNEPLYILGEYIHSRALGRYIAIYYGSFTRAFGELDCDSLKSKLRTTIRHEFRHHIESLAGNHDLEKEDDEELAFYRNGTATKS